MSPIDDASGLLSSGARPPIPGDGPQRTAELLEPGLTTRPGALALIGASARYTYSELDREVDRAANALRSLGIASGDRIAVCLPNDVDIVVHFLAVQRIGAVWVGIQRPLAPREKAELLADCGAGVFVADADLLGPVAATGVALPRLEHALSLDGWRARVRDASTRRLPVEIDPFAPAAIAYTSGTTGFPKGAVHSQHNLLLAGAMLVLTGAQPEARVGVALSLTLLNMMVRAAVSALYGARTLVCIERHDVATISDWVERESVGCLDLVPTLARDLLGSEAVGDRLRSLEDVVLGGSGCPPGLVAEWSSRFGCRVSVAYGMTEAPTGVARSSGEPIPAPGYAGVAVPQVELQVVDEQGVAAQPGEMGELCVAPASSGRFADVYTPMLGYWRRPEETREVLRGGRYHTGDLGFIDEHDRVFVCGRRSELIVRGGANVVPAEVERVLEAHSAVSRAAVLGIEDERLGERVVAAVELVAPGAADEAGLRAHAAESLARYKVPDRIEVVAELPRNALQKIVKRDLLPLFDTASEAP